MQPQSKNDGFQPKWRIFHPQATVWVQNILDHDVTFQVADEYNNAYIYKMPQAKTSELPGGAVATLGVKALVDELIQRDPKDMHLMWDKSVREKYEDKIIIKVKEAPLTESMKRGGEIDLTIPEDVDKDVAVEVTEDAGIEKPVFPTRKKQDFAGVAGKKDQLIEE